LLSVACQLQKFFIRLFPVFVHEFLNLHTPMLAFTGGVEKGTCVTCCKIPITLKIPPGKGF
jgi:hypothetical protein